MKTRVWLFFLLIVLASNRSVAQSPISKDSTEKVLRAGKILVVPFEDRMFFTDIMRELSQGSGMTPQEVISSLRSGIVKSIGIKLSDADSSIFLHPDSVDKASLESIYEHLVYKFTPVRISPKNPEKEPVGIHEGQVRTVRDTSTRYMACAFKDTAVLSKLSTEIGVQKLIVLNQMEVRMDLSNPDLLATDPQYIVAIHYTILDTKGSTIAGGLASRKFSQGDHNIRLMMFATFPDLAKTIVASEGKTKGTKAKERKSAK